MNATPTDDLLNVQEMQQALPFAGEIYGSENLEHPDFSEYSKEEENCKGCMGPCGMCTPFETFLSVNAAEIGLKTSARIRECVAKGATRMATELIPDYLQDAFRRILEQMYRERVAGQKFNAKAEVMPTPGKPDSRMSKNSRL